LPELLLAAVSLPADFFPEDDSDVPEPEEAVPPSPPDEEDSFPVEDGDAEAPPFLLSVT
jgi:hypothetical protein